MNIRATKNETLVPGTNVSFLLMVMFLLSNAGYDSVIKIEKKKTFGDRTDETDSCG